LSGIGEGGLVTTNDADLAARVRQLRNHGSRERYYHPVVGGNFRMAAVQAAALLVKLDHLDAWNAQRRDHAAYYDAHLPADAIGTPHLSYAREHHVYNQYVIRLADRRDACRDHLREQGIASEIFYPVPFHLQECFAGLGYAQGDFPQSELAAAQTLAIPVYPELTTAMQDYVIETLFAFYA
ncbi:MAG: DegT/DnrJ/EryC1/StrS family aminotransferase, partial [Candidatus Hydrogenedentes bacterium]|nr:DegT/DnrJ/EryC1/StrS family aminotransferase [Candidatus Hydrogenedentota bacterium]